MTTTDIVNWYIAHKFELEVRACIVGACVLIVGIGALVMYVQELRRRRRNRRKKP